MNSPQHQVEQYLALDEAADAQWLAWIQHCQQLLADSTDNDDRTIQALYRATLRDRLSNPPIHIQHVDELEDA